MSVVVEVVNTIVPLFDPPAPVAPPGSDKVLTVVSWISWGAAIVGFVGFVIVGFTMMLSSNRGQGSSETAKRLAMVLGGLVLVGAAGGLITIFLGV